MRNFILAVNKYKKWIALSIFLVCTILVLVFPLTYLIQQDNSYKAEPFIKTLFRHMYEDSDGIKMEFSPLWTDIYTVRLFFDIIALVLLVAFLCFGIISTIFFFIKKNILMLWSIIIAFFLSIWYSFDFNPSVDDSFTFIPSLGNTGIKMSHSFNPTTIIFLVLLILDIVYLCLERKYLKEVKQEEATEEVVKTF